MKAMQNNKRINMPESLLTEMENLRSEVYVLRRTVDSKSAAVVILQQQLVQSTALPTGTQQQATQTDVSNNLLGISVSMSLDPAPSNSSVLVELLSASKKENKALKQDIMDLRCKLHDAQADLKVVRSEAPRPTSGPLQQQWHRQERLHLIHSIEALGEKVCRLESDVRCLTEEREELLREREHNTDTIAGLNRRLRAAAAVSGDSRRRGGGLAKMSSGGDVCKIDNDSINNAKLSGEKRNNIINEKVINKMSNDKVSISTRHNNDGTRDRHLTDGNSNEIVIEGDTRSAEASVDSNTRGICGDGVTAPKDVSAPDGVVGGLRVPALERTRGSKSEVDTSDSSEEGFTISFLSKEYSINGQSDPDSIHDETINDSTCSPPPSPHLDKRLSGSMKETPPQQEIVRSAVSDYERHVG